MALVEDGALLGSRQLDMGDSGQGLYLLGLEELRFKLLAPPDLLLQKFIGC